jgi:hypothetical protein
MHLASPSLRILLGSTVAVLSLASTLLAAACAAQEPDDFPVMRLTSPPAADSQTSQ